MAGAAALVGAHLVRPKIAPTATSTVNSNCSPTCSRVEQDYVTPIDEQRAMEAAIQGMLALADPHSRHYANAEDYREMQKPDPRRRTRHPASEEGVWVVSPDRRHASGARRHPGGRLSHRHQRREHRRPSLNEAVTRMRGEAGTDITITIAREGSDPVRSSRCAARDHQRRAVTRAG